MNIKELDQELERFQKKWCRSVSASKRPEMLSDMAAICDVKTEVMFPINLNAKKRRSDSDAD